jgi:hypothetical protein
MKINKFSSSGIGNFPRDLPPISPYDAKRINTTDSMAPTEMVEETATKFVEYVLPLNN